MSLEVEVWVAVLERLVVYSVGWQLLLGLVFDFGCW